MRLSEFKDERGIEVVAKLMGPISIIASNKKNADARDEGTFSFSAALLQNNPKEIMAMLAILDNKDPADYHCSAATVLRDVFNMISDPELLMLFGLQSQNPASSGSASETTAGPKPQKHSSATPVRGSKKKKKKKSTKRT